MTVASVKAINETEAAAGVLYEDNYIDVITEARDWSCGFKNNSYATFDWINAKDLQRQLELLVAGKQFGGCDDMLAEHFWEQYREVELCGVDDELKQKICKKVARAIDARIKKKKRRWKKYRHGIDRSTKSLDIAAAYMRRNWPREAQRFFFGYIPFFSASKKATVHTVERVSGMQHKLIERIRGGGKKCPEDQSQGVSLAKTVVNGGTYSNKEAGISGSVHDCSTFGAKTKGAIELSLLEEEMLNCISDLIVESFGHCEWYIHTMEKLKNIPSFRLIKGSRIPCSHIWWTSSNKAWNVHIDLNTVGPAFLFTAETYEGGDLYCLTPDGLKNAVLEKGKVVGGLWSSLPHCSSPSEKGRRSFVVYLDYRVLRSNYMSVIKC